MALDLYRTDEAYVAAIDLPGADASSIDVNVEGRVLTVRAERTSHTEDEVQWLVHHRPTGTFTRRFTLGEGVDADGITATYTDGVLTLNVPVAEQAKARRIEVATPQSAATPEVTQAA